MPLVQFYRLIDAAPEPRRAERSACGTLPLQAVRYCEPVAAASGFGWYIYPPINFKLMLDDDQILYTYEGADGWFALNGAAQFPGFVDEFMRKAPPGLGEPPTWLAQGLLPGTVQVWSGWLANTAPNWSLLVRGVSNYVQTKSFDNFEGIIETNVWFGPLFTNIRLKRTNAPVEFHTRYPMMQVQPISRNAYISPSFDIINELSREDWWAFERTIRPNTDQQRRLGRYAVESRRRGDAVTEADAEGQP